MVFLRAVAVGVTVGLAVWVACTVLNLLTYGKKKREFDLEIKEEKRRRHEAAKQLAEDTEQRNLILRCMLDCGLLPTDEDGHFGEETLRGFERFWEHVRKEAER